MSQVATTRRRFLLGGTLATTAGLALGALPAPAGLASVGLGEGPGACCPRRIALPGRARQVALGDLAEGNRQAEAVARRSPMAVEAYEALLALAAALPDATLAATTVDLLRNPAPTYQLRSPSPTDREAVRQELLAEGLLPERTTVDGIFPPVPDPRQAPQPLWAAPGSSYGAHHAYPGGLGLHEWFNALLAGQYATSYSAVYGTAEAAGEQTLLLGGPPLWHDIHKVSVFQWLPDGSELAEQIIADTGAHHAISGAEALVRGLPATWVVAQLSAHDAPTNVQVTPTRTGRQRLVNYLRAAAIIARVDPTAAGLRRGADGEYELAVEPPPRVAYINHFSDQDWLFTNDSLAALIAALRRIAADYGIDPAGQPARFNLFRNLVLSQLSDVRLYETLETGGVATVRVRVDAEVDLSQLRA
jgi:hypothetical protein